MNIHFIIFTPFFSSGDITDRGVKPYIKILVFRAGDLKAEIRAVPGNTPLQKAFFAAAGAIAAGKVSSQFTSTRLPLTRRFGFKP